MKIIIFILFSITLVHSYYDADIINTALNISQAAYCMTNMDRWICATCTDTNIFETKIIEGHELVITGYNKIYNSIFIGFRGSSNIQNWLDNLQISQINPYDDQFIAVEKGFYKIYDSLQNSLHNTIDELSLKYQTTNILITGHSLGGAIASLFAFDIYYHSFPYHIESLITFGSPRVGNDYFSEYMHSFKITSYRITHYYDIVPHVPEEFFNYKHISEEIWYSENNMDYLICQDENKEDSNCSNSCSPLKCTSFDDHLNYMNISMGNDGLC
jgi:predicted lipase